MDHTEKDNLFTYLPKRTSLPDQRLNKIKDRLNQENQKPNLYKNKLSNYIDEKDVDQYQQILRKLNNKTMINDNIFEMFKYAPRLAGVKRESNPLLFYNQPTKTLRFY